MAQNLPDGWDYAYSKTPKTGDEAVQTGDSDSSIDVVDGGEWKVAYPKKVPFANPDTVPGENAGRTFSNIIDDAIVAGTKGFLSLGESVAGLANMATFGASGKALDNAGIDFGRVGSFLESKYSEPQQEANKAVSEAKGFGGKAKATFQNPSTIATVIGESLPSSIAGGMVIGRGILWTGKALSASVPAIISKYAPHIAAGLGEGFLSMGQNSENIRKASPGRELTAKGYGAAIASGIGTAFFGALGGTVANKFGFNDIDTMFVKMGVNKTPASIAQRIIGGGLTEGLLEELPQSVQEQIWLNAALDKPLMEGVPEGAAQSLIVGAAMGAGAGVISGPDIDQKKGGDTDPEIDKKQKVIDSASDNPDDISLIHGAAVKSMTTVQQRSLEQRMNDIENPEARTKAVDEMEKAIIKSAITPEEGQRKAKIFAEHALAQIDAGEQITIDSELSAYGAMSDEEKQAHHAEVEKGLVDETMAAIESRIQNLQKLKTPTPGQQANIEKYQADLDALVKYKQDPNQTGMEDTEAAENVLPEDIDAALAAGESAEKTKADKPVSVTKEETLVVITPSPDEEVQKAAQDIELSNVNTDPTDAEKEAGNYKKGHITVQGHQITIENPYGSTRKGTDKSGKPWESKMNGHYGYFKRTLGKDGDQVDVIVKPGEVMSPKTFIVDQVDPGTGKFDEHKVIMGTSSEQEARDLYLSNYEKGWKGLGAITELGPVEFKEWLKDSRRTKKPMAQQPAAPVKKAETQQKVPAAPATGTSPAETIEVTRLGENGARETIKVSEQAARMELKDNEVTIKRLEAVLECLS